MWPIGTETVYLTSTSKFVSVSSVSVGYTDPSVYTVFTTKSRDSYALLVYFLWFRPHWDVAINTFRPVYFHRNAASEFLAIVCLGRPWRPIKRIQAQRWQLCGWSHRPRGLLGIDKAIAVYY
ncbi:Homogentisate 1-2-dioxygenase [Penicillium concentricum]|uniref:homogentisate 1,2-dioxygenase n=1 Tax=Penicillium concentricum TaxID=293559 RepID=A0A9W9R997_9EURO|nr:Homogentisate 1-2-dioxygenase [Penicillium concentricum]KAJ5355921.1 Homogentisate 1-2-dioxygenase [Penicillium concentricum]